MRIPFLSFQFLRRSGCIAKLLCYHTAGEFAPHRLHQDHNDFLANSREAPSDGCPDCTGALLFGGLSLRAQPNDSRKGRQIHSNRSLLCAFLLFPKKNGKTEFEVDAQNPEKTVVCVHSLFPHSGHLPCWYVKPRIDQPIPMTIFRFSFFHL